MSLCLAPRGELAFLIDPIGPGTRALARSSRATRSPCSGRSATASASTFARPLLVGGGIGIAPLPYLSEALGRPPAVLGFRSEHHAEAAALVPNAEVVIDPVLVTDAMPRRAATCSRAAPSRCSRRVRALAPDAQLAWEAPMACGYGACYGCVGRDRRRAEAPLRRRAGAVLLLNASGCLDALDRARHRAAARRLRDEDGEPEPREGTRRCGSPRPSTGC